MSFARRRLHNFLVLITALWGGVGTFAYAQSSPPIPIKGNECRNERIFLDVVFAQSIVSSIDWWPERAVVHADWRHWARVSEDQRRKIAIAVFCQISRLGKGRVTIGSESNPTAEILDGKWYDRLAGS